MMDWLENKEHILSPEARTLLEHAIKIKALVLDSSSSIELKSGRLSPYFFNSGGFVTGEDLRVLTEAYISAVRAHSVLNTAEAVYGPPYKGISLATNFALLWGGSLIAASSRKEAKDHGEGGIHLHGDFTGKRTLLIDDVMSSGDSAEKGLRYIESRRGIPIGGVIAFDRQEQAKDSDLSATQQFRGKYCMPVVAAATLDDLITLLREQNNHVIVEHILRYRARYGALPERSSVEKGIVAAVSFGESGGAMGVVPIDEGRDYGPLPG